MNNTLTGLGLALVLALAAALIGPWFINWTAYRDDFARQASEMVGAPVTLTGAVDARLLPSPYVRFRGLTSGAGPTRLSVDEVEIELAVAPLLRGEFRAARLKLVRPWLGAELTPDGAVRTAFSAGRMKGAAERASIDRAEIVDGAVRLATPSGAFEVTRLAGLAEAGSLAGPFKFEGAAFYAGAPLKVRLATTRADGKGAVRAKLFAEREDRSRVFEADGALNVAAKPSFEGRASLSRPAREDASGDAPNPWRVTADVKGADGRLRFDNLDAAFGQDDRAIRFGGRGEATLGTRPRVQLALESRQVDLDRSVGDGRPKTPGAMLRHVLERADEADVGILDLDEIDASVALDIRSVVLAGDVSQDVRAEFEGASGRWTVRRASATLPGGAKVELSGAVTEAGGRPGFEGALAFAATDLAGLRRWLGGGEQQGASLARRLSVKGQLKASALEIDIDKAEFTADGARSTGHLAWRAGDRDRVVIALDSDRLDLDALGAGRLLGHALKGAETDVAIALDAGAVVLGGVEMKDVSLDGAIDRAGVDLKSLLVKDAGGARIVGAGRIAPGAAGPQGSLDFRVEAEDIRPLIALARAAGAAEPALSVVRDRAAAISPVALELSVEADETGRRLEISGDAAGGRLEARLSAAELSLDAESKLDATFRTADGRRLAELIGVALSPLAEAGAGEARVRLAGAPSKGMTGEASLKAIGLDLAAKGGVAIAPLVGLSGEADVTLKSDDFSRLGEAIGRLTPGAISALPGSLSAKVAASSDAVRIDQLSGEIAGRRLSGRLTAPLDPARPFDGAVEVSEMPAALLGAFAFSPEAVAPAQGADVWPRSAFGAAPLRGLQGRVAVTAARMPLAGAQTATAAKFDLALRRNTTAIENFSAKLDGGRISGSANVMRSDGQAALNFAIQLEGVRADRLSGLGPSSAVTGLVDLKLEGQGAGKSLAEIAGALTGAGTAALSDGALKRLDVSAMKEVEPLVEAGLALDAPKIADAVARGLDGDDFAIGRATVPFTVSAGVLRTGAVAAENPKARLGGGISLDLKRLILDADLTLQPNLPEAPQVVVSFEGPLSSPKRRVDATGFTGWLTVRAVERETARIDAMEADIRERAKIARQRAEEERKRAEEERRRVDEERRKAEAERKKREAEARAVLEASPRPAVPQLPSALDIMPPGVTGAGRPALLRPTPLDPPASEQPAAPR